MAPMTPEDIVRLSWPSLHQTPREPTGRFYPSNLVNGCLFACYHDALKTPGLKEDRTFESNGMMDVGKYIHEQVQQGMAKHYDMVGWTYSPELRIQFSSHCSGRCDADVHGPQEHHEVHEYKTCSKSVFDSLGKTPLEKHEDQLQLYMSRTNATLGYLLYICRNDFSTRQYRVPYSPDRAKKMWTMLLKVEDAITRGVPPETKKHWFGTSPCTSSCRFRGICPEVMNPTTRKL